MANSALASQEIICILYKTEEYYRVLKTPILIRILNQINSFQAPILFLKAFFNIIHPSTPRSSKWSPFLRFPQQNTLYIFPLSF